MHYLRHLVFVLILMATTFIMNTPAVAGRYIVDSVSDSTDWTAAEWKNYPNSPSNTPCSWQTAMVNADDDDVVYFRGGTYNVDGCRHNRPRMQPCNSGSAGHYITFMAYPNETPIIHNQLADGATGDETNVCSGMDCSAAGGGGMATAGLIGGRDRSYIIWDGFKLTAEELVGRVVIWNSSYITIKNSEIIGHNVNCGAQSSDMGNYDGFRIESSNHITIENNLIHGTECTENNHGNGIKLYESSYVDIYNNTVFDVDGAIVDKDGGQHNKIHNNFIYDLSSDGDGIRAGMMAGDVYDDIKVYNNVIIVPPNRNGIRTSESGNSNFQAYNNSIYASSGGLGIKIVGSIPGYSWNNTIYGFSIPLDAAGCTNLNNYTSNPNFNENGDGDWQDAEDFKLQYLSPETVKTGGRGDSYASYIGAWEWPINTNQQIGFSGDGIGNTPQPPTNPTDFQGNLTYFTP